MNDCMNVRKNERANERMTDGLTVGMTMITEALKVIIMCKVLLYCCCCFFRIRLWQSNAPKTSPSSAPDLHINVGVCVRVCTIASDHQTRCWGSSAASSSSSDTFWPQNIKDFSVHITIYVVGRLCCNNKTSADDDNTCSYLLLHDCIYCPFQFQPAFDWIERWTFYESNSCYWFDYIAGRNFMKIIE